MGAKTRSQSSSDREKWDKIFNGLVKMLKTQQGQLETLVKERKILEDRIKMQHERWVSDIRIYEDHISQMGRELQSKEMASVLEAAKSDLLLGLKQREACLYKLKLDRNDEDLADFKLLFDILCNDPERNYNKTENQNKGGRNSECESTGPKKLEHEVRRLKLEYDKLVSEKNSEVSALLAEKKFVWNQYTVLENNLNDKLKSKQAELKDANEKIAALLASIEQLQSSHREKDEVIVRLTTEVSEMETQTNKCNNEMSRLSKELELLRNSRSASKTPVIKHCSAGSRSSNLGDRNGGRDGRNVVVKKESSALLVSNHVKYSEKGGRTPKRKELDVITISEPPKLFTSTFKVPKLKSSSPNLR